MKEKNKKPANKKAQKEETKSYGQMLFEINHSIWGNPLISSGWIDLPNIQKSGWEEMGQQFSKILLESQGATNAVGGTGD